MATLSRPDGVELHYEIRGNDGPLVVLAPYWSWSPGIFDEFLDDLASDHRVLVSHLRGTGLSSRQGPYDMETDTADLEALIEEAGGPALVIGIADSANRASKLAARRPDLVPVAIALGAGPLSRKTFAGEDAMLGSDTVLDAFIEMVTNNYRAAMRTLMTATNQQMNEGELRERVNAQVEHVGSGTAVTRVRAWADDDPDAEARQIGERLVLITAPTVAGAWLPDFERVLAVLAEKLPQAQLEIMEDGVVSRPHEGAELVRKMTAPLRS
jgi:pimeloyl-ACP methyl ester carboxylesterase